MKKILPILLSLFLLAGCGTRPTAQQTESRDSLSLVATTYPVYLLVGQLVQNVDGVTLSLLVDQPVSCLHDYTLSVQDMKVLSGADVLLCSGGGLEDTMADALASTHAEQIDASAGIDLLPMAQEHDHDHDDTDHDDHAEDEHDHDHDDADHDGHDHGEFDPHIWMDPNRAARMMANLSAGLSRLDPDHARTYEANLARGQAALATGSAAMKTQLQNIGCRDLITFHDGFQYFADAFDLHIVRAIEEEAGSEASAREVRELLEEIRFHDLPAIFTEKNGATATAELISRETGIPCFQLDLMMSGETADPGVDTYLTLLQTDIDTIQEAMQ